MAANPAVPETALKLDTERTPTETIVHYAGKITVKTAPLFQDTIRGIGSQVHRSGPDTCGSHRQCRPGCAGGRVVIGKKEIRRGRVPLARAARGRGSPTRSSWSNSTTTSESRFTSPGWTRCSAFPTNRLAISVDVGQHSILRALLAAPAPSLQWGRCADRVGYMSRKAKRT